MGKIKSSFNLVKSSFKFILEDKELLVYSLISSITLLLILGGFSIIGFFIYPSLESFLLSKGVSEELFGYLFILVGVIYYFLLSFITFYFNTAIISSVQNRINGNDNKFMDGIRYANKNLGGIVKWSLVNTAVNVFLMILENIFKKDSFIGRIIVSIIGATWNIATYFSFPLIILEKKGVKDSIKESTAMFKKTWGERAFIYVGVGMFFGILFVLNLLIGFLLMYIGLVVFGIILTVILTLLIILFSSTCSVVLKTVVYNYTINGKVPEIIKNDNVLENMIKN